VVLRVPKLILSITPIVKLFALLIRFCAVQAAWILPRFTVGAVGEMEMLRQTPAGKVDLSFGTEWNSFCV